MTPHVNAKLCRSGRKDQVMGTTFLKYDFADAPEAAAQQAAQHVAQRVAHGDAQVEARQPPRLGCCWRIIVCSKTN